MMTVSTADLVDNEHVGYHQHQHNHRSHNHHSHIPITNDGDDLVVSTIRGLLIVSALSVHELFEDLQLD